MGGKLGQTGEGLTQPAIDRQGLWEQAIADENWELAAQYQTGEFPVIAADSNDKPHPGAGGRMSYMFGLGDPDNGIYIDF